ncbi:two-component system response regulator [Vibrio makurazakiensis]|uniref:response regulator n=1 Tax=Vibrio makurazakiensis TaxID=2910250 RepID=UPI003D1229C7
MDKQQETVLVVDDIAENRVLLHSLLKPHFQVRIATCGAQAVEAAHQYPPDIILLDIMMPQMDGYEVCRRLKNDRVTEPIPIIFLTAKSQIEDEEKGFEMGAVDYLLKPISPPILLSRVNTHLRLKRAISNLSKHNDLLEEKVKMRTHELESLQGATISAMASLAETRDNETGNHIRRTQRYVKVLAEELLRLNLYKDQLRPESLMALYKSAPLHDIGKVGIPDQVLLKPGKLTEEEFDIMKAHALLGREVIETVEESIDFSSDFLVYAKEIAYCHHEKWDGSGYPQGLKGENIPLSARLMAIADVYDALISKRVYKPPFSHEQSVQIITEGRDQHFDPVLIDIFLTIEDTFKDIADAFRDADVDEKPEAS